LSSDLRKDHWCVEDIGLNASCGDPADDLRGGFWMCPVHIARFDFDVYATAVLDDAPEDWDIESAGTVTADGYRAQDEFEGQRRYEHWQKCVLEDDPTADVSMEAYADDLLATYEANVEESLDRGFWGILRGGWHR